MTTQIVYSASGVGFERHDENYLRCSECDGLVARPDYPYGIRPSEHVCH